MKRLTCILILLAVAVPSWAATKMTVTELKDKLIAMQRANSNDEAVSTELKQVTLTEQLTSGAKADLLPHVPGPLSEEQIDILEGRTSMLAPPPTDLPSTPAPDAAAQKAILAKAQDFVAKSLSQSPHLTASRSVSRFQDDTGNSSSTIGLVVATPNTFTRLVEAHTERVEFDKGVEKPALSKNKTKWGANGLISEGEPGPLLAVAVPDLINNGKPEWLRWETVGGKPVAVFAFAVEKKKSHFDISYCCFPQTDTQAEIAVPAGGVVAAQGNIQSVSTFNWYKKVVGYHGQVFIDPASGAIVRFITNADMRPSDFIHQEIMRVDYAPVVVGGAEYTLPADSFTVDEVVPGGDSAAYAVRHTLFTVRYQNYLPYGAAQ